MPVVPEKPKNDASAPKGYRCADRGIKIYAAKCFTLSHYKKRKRIIGEKNRRIDPYI